MRQGGRKRPCKDNEQGLIPSENEQNLHFALAHNLRFSVSLLAWNSDVAAGGFASLSHSLSEHIKKVQRSTQ
jgi:hypothetical protein